MTTQQTPIEENEYPRYWYKANRRTGDISKVWTTSESQYSITYLVGPVEHVVAKVGEFYSYHKTLGSAINHLRELFDRRLAHAITDCSDYKTILKNLARIEETGEIPISGGIKL